MQRYIHKYNNVSRIFSMIESLYTFVSDDTEKDTDIVLLDPVFKPLCEILMENVLWFRTPMYREFPFPKVDSPFKEKEITVCISGGKDSAAAAKYWIDKGYKVHGYHQKGMNRSYKDEWKHAEQVCEYLGIDIYIDEITVPGDHPFVEHPMKNYLIACGALNYCIAMGYSPVLSFGNFQGSHVEDSPFDVCGGDCIEMWYAFENIIHKVIPNFKMRIPLKTMADSYYILAEDWKLFEMCLSCMTPYRFRNHFRHRCEQSYNVRFMENRCGVCWKCCVECVWMMDKGYMPYDEVYYLHCIEIFASTILKEYGEAAEDIETVWTNYMFYPMKESRAYDYLIKFNLRKQSSDIMRARKKEPAKIEVKEKKRRALI